MIEGSGAGLQLAEGAICILKLVYSDPARVCAKVH